MSTINYTYNVIVDRFRQFAAGHFQLRRFTHGEISQADLEKEAEWPWLHVKPRAINYASGTRTFSFEIFISDLPRDKEDKTGYQAESITDCSLIFQDLINEIYLGNMFGSNVELTRPVNSEPFVEQYTHTLTGVTGIIELNLDYDWSACSIPASWNYNTPTDSGTDGWGALQFIESLDQNGAFVSLLNDVEAPGNSYYYGTNAEGIKGWYAIVDNVGLTCETLPDCATIISILDDIAALQTDVALKANTADLGATAFSNDYNDLDNLPTIPSIAGLATVTYVDQQDNLKVDKIAGKGLSTEDYTTAEKSKLAGIQAGAEVNVNADWNAVSGDAQILNKPTIPSIAGLATVTYVDAQDATKQNTLVSGTNIKTIEGQSLLGAGNIDLTKSDVGLANVDNTSDLNKPISTATQTALNAKQDSLGFTPVPTTRSITINGTTQDLSADRTFTIATNPGTVTSVAVTSGTGISITGSPITSSGTITVTNSAPDQVVALTAGTGIGVTGTYPNFTITNSSPSSGGTVTSVAALTLGTTGTDLSSTVANSTSTPVITLNVPTASATNRGVLSSADWSTFNGKFTLPSLTSGSVLFSNGTTIAQNNANFFWDNTNSRLGIGTNAPSVRLDVVGDAIITGATALSNQNALLVRNTSAVHGLSVTNNAEVKIGRNQLFGFFDTSTGGYTFNITATNSGVSISNNAAASRPVSFSMNTGEILRIHQSYTAIVTNNFLVGTTTDAGYKLDVNGTTRLNGLSSINGAGVANTALAVYGNGNGAGNYLFRMYDASAVERFFLTASGNFKMSSATDTGTTGDDEKFRLALAFAPTSGTRNHYGLYITQTINQTGGASGITRGLYINPTLTAVADFRAIEVANGITVLGASTTAKASLRIPSGTAPTSPVDGDIWYDGTNLKMRVGAVTKTFTLI